MKPTLLLEDALAIVICDHQPDGGELIGKISILKPGLTHLTLKEWLESTQRMPLRGCGCGDPIVRRIHV
jgi:hypothetical protein